MSLLSDPDIAAMRSTLVESLPDTCVIQNSTFGDDSGGGGSQTWAAAGTVACRIAPLAADEQTRGDRVSEDSNWVITLPAETSIQNASRVIVNGGTYNVSAVRERGSWEISRRVEAVQQT